MRGTLVLGFCPNVNMNKRAAASCRIPVSLFILGTLLFLDAGVNAQPSYGVQLIRGAVTGYSKVDYRYRPTILQFESFTPIRRNLDFVVQRQLNVVRFEDAAIRQTAWETGLNLGIVVHRELGKKLKIYALGSTGPHYVSNTPRRQADGFIFSDNFRTGILIPLSATFAFDLCTGIRHISNAGLKRPNKGVDNVLVGFGVKYTRRRMAMK